MFFHKKKAPEKPKKARPRAANDFVIPGIPGFDPNIQDNDADLEAELLAISGGSRSTHDDFDDGAIGEDDLESELARILGNTKKPPKRIHEVKQSRVNDLPAGSSMDVEDEDDDIDENDPELLSELNEITGEGEVSENVQDEEDNETEPESESSDDRIPSQLEVITKRLRIYREAEAQAKAANESARARRFNRGVKTLEKQKRQAQAGTVIPADEIPPEIALPKPRTDPPMPEQKPTDVNKNLPEPSTMHAESKVEEDTKPRSQIEIIRNRLKIYKEAEVIAKTNNDTARSRRYNQGIKTLESLIRDAQSGKTIPDDQIPPEISLPKISNSSEDAAEPAPELPPREKSQPPQVPHRVPPPPPTRTTSIASDIAPSESLDSISTVNTGLLQELQQRRDEYKKQALTAKKSGDISKALVLVKNVKVLNNMVELAARGKTIDEATIPPPLAVSSPTKIPGKPKIVSQAPSVPYIGEVFSVPNTVLEALNQRLKYYQKAQRKAEIGGQRVQAKKFSSIVLIYQNAIKLHQKGAEVPYEKLPTPPGCPPIPIAFKI